jgi:phosphoglycerate dehydrogenase-like enzyme
MAAIAISRRLAAAERNIRTGGVLGAPLGRALLGRSAGILGVGGVGQALAARLRPFGMRMNGVDQRSEPELADRLGMDWIRPLAALPELMSRSDYLFLCLPLTDATRNIIDAGALAKLPAGACVVNAGRGGLLDQAALLAALESGQLMGAALDVFEPEPLDPASPLLTRSDVLATPHIAGVTDASFNGVGERVAANIRRLLNGEKLKDCVNGDALA